MNGRGRPLRFIAVVVIAWGGARGLMLWPEAEIAPVAAQSSPYLESLLPPEFGVQPPLSVSFAALPTRKTTFPRQIALSRPSAKSLPMMAMATAVQDQPLATPSGVLPPAPIVLATIETPRSRWSGSAWAVTRRGASAGGAMLGGDQAGVRIAYALDPQQRARLYVRASAALAMPQQEVAAGIDWQPSDLPVRLVAEYRAGIEGIGSGPAAGIVGGVSEVPIAQGFTLEAYGQAGAMWRDKVEPFADAALRTTREVASAGKLRLAIGAGLWGAAQRDASRLDVGPSAVATLPLGRQAVRLALDWRERVAGDARPGSGPALTLGTDF